MTRKAPALLLLICLPALAVAQPRDDEAQPPPVVEATTGPLQGHEQVLSLRMLHELYRGQPGPWEGREPYRRASDRTLNWKEIQTDWRKATARGLDSEARGLLRFGMALFLKELVIVAQTGDRGRIDEFFEGLKSTDFFLHYGLFAAGARVGDVAYSRYMARFVRPGIASQIARTHVALAVGMALPAMISGEFDGKAYVISLASLGLSASAVMTATAGIEGLMTVRQAQAQGKLAALGQAFTARYGWVAKAGGVLYQTGKLVLILYLGEQLEGAVHAYLGRRKARRALAAATEELAEALSDPSATRESVRAAGEAYHAAWNDHRRYLYLPLQLAELRLAQRLEGVAREAKLDADVRRGMLSKLEGRALVRQTESSGQVEDYVERLMSESEDALLEQTREEFERYVATQEGLLEQVYAERRRDGLLLRDPHSDWLPAGRARRNVVRSMRRASLNRLQAYEDEREVLISARSALERNGRSDLGAALTPVLDVLDAIEDADLAFYGEETRPPILDRALGE